jgi:hypothetical protein
VPESLTTCGLFAAPSVKVSVPERKPVAVGEKVTPTVHFAPAVMLPPHVLLATAKPALGVVLLNTRAMFWWFVSVTVLARLVVPTDTVPKLNEATESVTGVIPVPARLTVCGLFVALSVKVSVPATGPVAFGENVTPTMHVAPVAMPTPHVLLATANPASAVVMLVKARPAF